MQVTVSAFVWMYTEEQIAWLKRNRLDQYQRQLSMRSQRQVFSPFQSEASRKVKVQRCNRVTWNKMAIPLIA